MEMSEEQQFQQRAREFMRALRWTRVRFDETETSAVAAECDLTGLAMSRVHRLIGYASADGSARELLWDARETLGPAPVFLRGADGTPMRIHSYSTVSVRGYPIRLGERVLLELSELRARQLAREFLDRLEREQPERYREAQEAFPSEQTALDATAQQLLEEGVSDVVTVTSAILGLLAERGAAVDQDADCATVQLDDDDSGEDVDFDTTSNDDAIAIALALASDLHATVGHLSYVDQQGCEIDVDTWARYRRDESYRKVALFELAARGTPNVVMQCAVEWFGLVVQIGDERRIVQFLHKTRLRTIDPPGAIPWKHMGCSRTRADALAYHERLTQHAQTERSRRDLETAAAKVQAAAERRGKA